MKSVESLLIKRLEKEAARWAEEELARRMVYAKEAIQEQANISLPEIGPSRAGDHLKKALALAEENIRMEVELEAQTWIDEELKKHRSVPDQGDP